MLTWVGWEFWILMDVRGLFNGALCLGLVRPLPHHLNEWWVFFFNADRVNFGRGYPCQLAVRGVL